jgi:hypothetical protein
VDPTHAPCACSWLKKASSSRSSTSDARWDSPSIRPCAGSRDGSITPAGQEVVLDDLQLAAATEVRLLGYGAPLRWQQRGAQVAVALPGDMPTGPAYTLVLGTVLSTES